MNFHNSYKKIGLLTPYCGGNLGDGSIQEAVKQNIAERCPAARIFGFNLNPEEIEKLHNIPSYLVAGTGIPSYPVVTHPQNSSSHEEKKDCLASKAKNLIKAIPLAYPLLRAIKNCLHVAHNELSHIVKSFHVLNDFDLLLVSGGGQIDDLWGGAWGHPYALLKWAILAKMTGTKFAFISVGASPPRSRLSKIFYRCALTLATYRSYRDQKSKKVVENIRTSRSDPCFPDLAFSLAVNNGVKTSPLALPHPIVGVGPIAYGNPRSWPKNEASVYDRYVQQLSSFIVWLLQNEYGILLFTSTRPDKWVIDHIKERIPAAVASNWNRLVNQPAIDRCEELLSYLQSADYIVASRLHGVILSHLLSKPVVALSFDRKVDSHMEEIGQQEYLLEIHQFDADMLIEKFLCLKANRQLIQSALSKKVMDYRASLSCQYDNLMKLLDEPA